MRARTRRLWTFLVAAILLAAAAALASVALLRNANLFYTPQLLAERGMPDAGEVIKIGGFVQPGSLTYADNAEILFTVSDNSPNTLIVSYTGITPSLFREGQGVVATGAFTDDNVFVASKLLAKHDENYQPRELRDLHNEGVAGMTATNAD